MDNLVEYLPTQIDVLRHGVCEGGDIFRGSTDVALSQEGWQQMYKSVDGLSWDLIISSPLKRCREFAAFLASEMSLDCEIDERWRECCFGIWEGQNKEDIWRQSPDDLMAFYRDPMRFMPEGAEPFVEVCARVQQAWAEMLNRYKGKRILLVTHAGIFRTLFIQLMQLPTSGFNNLDVPYACLSRWVHYVDASQAQPSLCFHNRQLG